MLLYVPVRLGPKLNQKRLTSPIGKRFYRAAAAAAVVVVAAANSGMSQHSALEYSVVDRELHHGHTRIAFHIKTLYFSGLYQ